MPQPEEKASLSRDIQHRRKDLYRSICFQCYSFKLMFRPCFFICVFWQGFDIRDMPEALAWVIVFEQGAFQKFMTIQESTNVVTCLCI